MLARLFRVQQQLTRGENHENKIQDHVFLNSISIASVFWISPLLAMQKLEENLHWFYLIK